MGRKFTESVIAILGVFLLSAPIRLAANDKCNRYRTHLGKVTTNYSYAPMLINDIFNYYGNNGDGSHNWFSSSEEGFEFPKGSGKTTVFEEGVVWGGFHHCRVNRSDTSILKVGGSTYNYGLQAGKILISGTAATAPVADNPNSVGYRMYRVRPDITPTTDDGAIAMEDSTLQHTEVPYVGRFQNFTAGQLRQQYWADWNDWPAADGAPFTDVNNDGKYDPAVDIPGVPGADQTMWYVANDCDSLLTRGLYGSDPIGIEMQRTIWAYKNGGLMDNVIFMRTWLINKSGTAIDSMFIGQWADPDVGYAGDDFAGCDTALSLGFAYNGEDVDAVYGNRAPAVGWMLLQGPKDVGSSSDTAIFEGRKMPGYKNLNMYSFNFFICAGDSMYTDPELDNVHGATQLYNDMNAFAGRTGTLYMNPLAHEPTRYALNGDPVTGIGWIDNMSIIGCGDVYLMESSGPFTMEPGDTQEVAIAAIIGQGADRLSSITALREVAQAARFAYENSVDTVINMPHSFQLFQNYPNPFNPSTTIQCALPLTSRVTIKIYNVLGQEVKTLIDGIQYAGTLSIVWNATSNSELRVSSGVYFYRMEATALSGAANTTRETKRMLLLR